MRKALLFLFCSAFLFGAHDPRMTKLDSYFPVVLMDPTDTLHFRPDEYKPGTQDTALAAFLYSCMKMDDHYYRGYYEISEESFAVPLMKTQLNGHTVYIVEVGDTNDVTIYLGRDVLMYLYSEEKEFWNVCHLAEAHAGEGPWQMSNSWLLDVDGDGTTDILTREIGEGYRPVMIGDDYDREHYSIDTFTAVALRDTGFVDLKFVAPPEWKERFVVTRKEY